MSIGLELGLIAAFCWGSTDVLAAIAGRRLGSLKVAAIVQLASMVAVLGVCAVRGTWFPARLEDTVVAIITGVVASGAYLSFFTALRMGPVSVISPVVAAYGGLTVILAVVLRGESLAPLQAIGAALATGGVILTGLVSDRGWRGTRVVGSGVPFAVVALLCFAVLIVTLAGPIRSSGWLPVLLTSRLANTVTVWLILAFVLVKRPRSAAALLAPSTGTIVDRWRIPLAVAVAGGLLDITGFVSFAIGLEQAPTWIVGLASSFGPVVSVIVAVVIWGERLRPSQWLGIVGIALGLLAVALP